MNHTPQEYTIWDNVLPFTITSSTDATPIVVTASSHGLKTGQQVMISGHATNIAANGLYQVGAVTTNTFVLLDLNSAANVAGSGAGAGSGGVGVLAPKMIFCEGFKSIQFQLETSGSASFTMKFANSFGKKESNITNTSRGYVNFGGTQSASNPYVFVSFVDLSGTGSITAGGTGIVTASTDLHSMYEVNTNGGGIMCPIITAWTAGTISLRARLFHFGN